MIDCPNATMRDLLPELSHGTLDARATAELQAHLATCAECRAELALLGRVRRAISPAPAIDLQRVVAGVAAARPAAPRIVRGTANAGADRWSATGRWRAVAAVLLVAGLATVPLVLQRQDGTEVEVRPDTLAMSGGPAAGAARQPQAARAGVSASPEFTFAGGVSDLDEGAIEALLDELDGVQSLPHAEPAPELTVDPLADTGAL